MPRAATPPYLYSLPSVYLAVPGTTILVQQHNDPLQDIATTLNTATPIQYGGTSATTVAGAQAALGITPTDRFSYPTATGTGNAIVVTNTSPLLALATGATASFTASAGNTTAVTINVDGLGAKAGRKIVAGADVALTAGDLLNADKYGWVYSAAANAAAGAWILATSNTTQRNAPNGTAALPAFSFDADQATGIYRIGANNIGVGVNGAKVLDVGTTGLGVTGTASTTDTISNTNAGVGFVGLRTTSTEAAAAAGPIIEDYRNSASPAIADVLGQELHTGQNSTPAKVTYAKEETVILSPTAGSEAATHDHYAMVAGVLTRVMSIGPNVDLAAVGQIKFPEVVNLSSNRTTLDQYAEVATATCTVTAGVGTITTASATSHYTITGNMLFFDVDCVITTNGTGATSVILSLPVSPTNNATAIGSGRAGAFNILQGQIFAGDAHVYVLTATNTYPGASGNSFNISGFYRIS